MNVPKKLAKGGLAGLLALGIIVGVGVQVARGGTQGPASGQVQLGLTFFDEDELTFLDAKSSDGQSTAHADLATMPTVGLGGMLPLSRGEAGDFGFEAGGLVGWASDSQAVPADNGKGEVMIDADWTVVDLSCGLFVRTATEDGLARFHAGAGPLFWLGQLHRDTIEGSPTWYTPMAERSESIFGYGLYGRLGVEFNVETGWLGLGARGTWGEMTFDGDTEDVDIRSLQGFLTFSSAW